MAAKDRKPLPKSSILLYAGESVQIYHPRVFIFNSLSARKRKRAGTKYAKEIHYTLAYFVSAQLASIQKFRRRSFYNFFGQMVIL
jgi:hypothetical protein